MYKKYLLLALFFITVACQRRVNVPEFEDEPEDVATILDYILVNWLNLSGMIVSRQGRSNLRTFVNQALRQLRICLTRYDHDEFRVFLRVLWNRRAQRYFDVHNRHPYPPYIFSIVPHVHTYEELLKNQGFENWEYRNPRLTREAVDSILNIHILTSPNTGEYDIYDWYERYGMRSTDYFFETRVDRFYRIVFYFIELRRSGILNIEHDFYENRLPFDVLHPNIQSIIESDFSYRTYLLKLRHDLLRITNDTDNPVRQNLARNGRVREEDLISLLLNIEPLHAPSTRNTTSGYEASSNSSMRNSFPSTTPSFGPGKRRGSMDSENREQISKRSKTSFPAGCCYVYQGESSNDNKSMESCFFRQYGYFVTEQSDIVCYYCSMMRVKQSPQEIGRSYKNYGYFIRHDDREWPMNSLEESFTFIQTLMYTINDGKEFNSL